MMNPNILNKNPLMFFDRAVNAQRSQLLTVMADAVSECRTAADPVSYTHLAAGIIGSYSSIDISSVMTDLEPRLMEMDLGPLFGLWLCWCGWPDQAM